MNIGIKKYLISCSKMVPTNVSNTKGKPYETYTTSTINGYVGKASSREIVKNDKTTIETHYNFICDDFDLNYGDRILYNSKYYEVVSEPQNTANKNHHIFCTVKMISNVRQ